MNVKQDKLDTSIQDCLAAVARGLAGTLPVVGSLVSEAVNSLIPNQKLDRVINFVKLLEQKISELKLDVETLKQRFSDEKHLDMFEDALVQASRAVSLERKQYLAAIVAYSFIEDHGNYERVKKVLRIIADLTDAEILYLRYYSHHGESRRLFAAPYGNFFRPASKTLGVSQTEIDRSALQEAYKGTLLRYQLLRERGTSFEISSLGKLVLRYIV